MTRRRGAPRRGDLVWIEVSPHAGHEQSGRRPAIVLSPVTYNAKAGLALLCPVTTREKGYPFEVKLPPGLPVQGVVLADQVRSLDWRARRVELACVVPDGVVDEVLGKLATLVG